MTISPNERRSCLSLRLSRYRENDPVLLRDPDSIEAAKRLPSRDSPKLESWRDEEDEEMARVDLPDYAYRRRWQAQDPLSTVDAFGVAVRIILTRLLGVRMCANCPHCNLDPSTVFQDRFGSNATAMGGIFGRCDAFAGAVAHQHSGTPHIHLKAHVVSAFQHNSTKEIARLIEEKLLDVKTIAEYTSWMCREEHFDQERHDASLDDIRQQWPNYSGEEHEARRHAILHHRRLS